MPTVYLVVADEHYRNDYFEYGFYGTWIVERTGDLARARDVKLGLPTKHSGKEQAFDNIQILKCEEVE